MKFPNQEVKNTAKNLTLLALAVLLVVLTVVGWLGELGLESVPPDSWLGRMYISLSYGTAGGFELRSGEMPAAEPVECAAWDGQALQGAQYNAGAVQSFRAACGAQITAALERVQALAPGEEDAFRAALRTPAFYLRYDSVLPLSLLHSWLGGGTLQTADDPQVTALLLTQDGTLWLRGAEQTLYTAPTGQAAPGLAARAQGFSGTPCAFAANLDAPYYTGHIHPETLLFADNLTLPVYESAPVRFDTGGQINLQQLMQAFGYEPYVRAYDDAESGKRIFVESQSTLRVGGDGQVVFRANTLAGGLEAYLDSELGGGKPLAFQIDYARRLLDTAAQAYTSDARMAFAAAQTDRTTGKVRLYFRYTLGGVPVAGAEGLMAMVEFQGNVLVAAELHLRTFTQTGTSRQLLPAAQAASAATDGMCGLRVGYFAGADGTFIPDRYYLNDGGGA